MGKDTTKALKGGKVKKSKIIRREGKERRGCSRKRKGDEREWKEWKLK